MMQINYISPSWEAARIAYARITDQEIKALRGELDRVNAQNEAIYKQVLEQHKGFVATAEKLYGWQSNVVRALYKISVPKPPDFSSKWQRILREVNKARGEIADQQRQAAYRLQQAEARRRRREAKRQVELEREEYVEGLPQSD
jgi:hypothetical protein